MIINKEIVEKYFYKIYDRQDYVIFNWIDRRELGIVYVYWVSDHSGSISIEYSTIIQGEREDKLNTLLCTI